MSNTSNLQNTASASQFVDQSDFEAHVRDAIQHASTPQVLVFTNVSSSWGQAVVDSINETDDGLSTRKNYNSHTKVLRITVMPTHIHDCVQDWWRVSEIGLQAAGDLTSYEQLQIQARVGTTLEFRSGPYRQSRKEPDFFLLVNDDPLPSLAIESGWSESWNNLMDDMKLLLVGGAGAIRVVVILNWRLNRTTRSVSGFSELYVRDRNGMPVRRQREVVFPVPPQTPTPQRLGLTRQETFGPHLWPDPTRNGPPQMMVYLEIDQLRLVATRALARMNLFPAALSTIPMALFSSYSHFVYFVFRSLQLLPVGFSTCLIFPSVLKQAIFTLCAISFPHGQQQIQTAQGRRCLSIRKVKPLDPLYLQPTKPTSQSKPPCSAEATKKQKLRASMSSVSSKFSQPIHPSHTNNWGHPVYLFSEFIACRIDLPIAHIMAAR